MIFNSFELLIFSLDKSIGKAVIFKPLPDVFLSSFIGDDHDDDNDDDSDDNDDDDDDSGDNDDDDNDDV